MTDELCAREGCGAPKAWHNRNSTVDELATWPDDAKRNGNHIHVYPFRFHPYSRPADSCLSFGCDCTAYLAPELPEPERKAYVVEFGKRLAQAWMSSTGGEGYTKAVPLDEYLAAHPQPAPALCICGGTADEHDPVTGRCQHKAHRMLYSDSGSVIERLRCGCQKFAAQP